MSEGNKDVFMADVGLQYIGRLICGWLCWWACQWARVVVCRVCSVLAWCWGPVVTDGKDTEVTNIAGITLRGFPFANPCPSYAVGIRTMVVVAVQGALHLASISATTHTV